VIGELKNVLIRLSTNPKVHQVFDIIVVDIPEVYGFFLSRDWLEQLHGYFSMDWSHLWQLENGKPNKIKVNREHYLKFTVIDLNDPNKPFTPSANLTEIQGMDTFFGNFMAETSTITNQEQQSEIMTCTQSTTFSQLSHAPDKNQIWSLYFDGSKSKEGVGAGCVIIDLAGNKTLISFYYNPKLHHTCLPGIRPTHIPSLPKHLLKNLFENPLGSRPTRPNPLLCLCERWQAYYSSRLPNKTQK
jgi:hypothetical protein